MTTRVEELALLAELKKLKDCGLTYFAALGVFGQKDEAMLARARKLYQTDDVEIDDCYVTSTAEEGTWISAWVWVPDEVKED